MHALLGNEKEPASQQVLGDDYLKLREAYASRRDFPCQQPAYAVWFRQQGLSAAEPAMACPDALPILMRDGGSGWKVRWLDLERVRAVHLLFAGKSSAPASRFGHVALRLVVCPDRVSARAVSSEACDTQVQEHVVLGFQAYVDDSEINMRRAIFGGYRARLLAQPFMEVYEQYTTAEFRDLYSLPLRMTPSEQSDFLRALVQLYWMHESDYRFFGSNCATLLQQTLTVFWPRYKQTAELSKPFMRPDHFFRAMQESGLVDAALLQDKKLALRDGYFFESNEAAYREAAQLLEAAMQQPFFSGLDGYLAVPAARRRDAIARDTALAAAQAANPRLRPAPLLLEELAMLRAERRVLQAAAALWEMKEGKLYYKGERNLAPEEAALMQDCLLIPLRSLLTPPPLQAGIPLDGGMDMAAPLMCGPVQKARLQQLVRQELQNAASDWRPLVVAVNELAETVANVGAWRRPVLGRHAQKGKESHVI